MRWGWRAARNEAEENKEGCYFLSHFLIAGPALRQGEKEFQATMGLARTRKKGKRGEEVQLKCC